MRAPDRGRSRSGTPSSRSSFPRASLKAGCDTCNDSLARRSEPCWVTAARYSSCSMRTRWSVPSWGARHRRSPRRGFRRPDLPCRLASADLVYKLSTQRPTRGLTMSLKFHWFLPTNGGDGRHVVGGGHGVDAESAGRPASVPYIGQVARSAEQLGFDAALTPTGAWCEDAWVSTAAISSVSERLKFLVAFRPGLTAPFLAAQMAGTFQNLTGGRLLLNVVVGGESHEQRMYGDFLDKDERYERCEEFLHIVRELWTGEPVTFRGRYLSVDDAVLAQVPDPLPAIYFGGSSNAGIDVAARHADVYLTWGEPPAAVAEKIARVRAAAEAAGRELRFGIRLHTIARDTSEAAWAEADRMLEHITEDAIARIQSGLRRSESEGQRRMLDLNRGSK